MSDHHHHHHHGIHVVTFDFDYVKGPLILSSFVLALTFIILGELGELLMAFIPVLHRAPAILRENLPESCVLILLGVVLGYLIELDPSDHLVRILQFKKETFFIFLLPP